MFIASILLLLTRRRTRTTAAAGSLVHHRRSSPWAPVCFWTPNASTLFLFIPSCARF